jgi:hypothetical protein
LVGAAGTTYPDLAARALTEAGHPLATPEIIAFIARHRPFRHQGRKAVVNVTSSLSHDDRLENMAWGGRRTWWFANRPLPDEKATPDGLQVNGHLVPEDDGDNSSPLLKAARTLAHMEPVKSG